MIINNNKLYTLFRYGWNNTKLCYIQADIEYPIPDLPMIMRDQMEAEMK